jgi:hypothetical protein
LTGVSAGFFELQTRTGFAELQSMLVILCAKTACSQDRSENKPFCCVDSGENL